MLPVRRLPTNPTGRSLIRYFAITVAAITVAVLAASALADAAPPTSYKLTAAAKRLRAATYATEPCLARIIDREDGWWDPTVDYGGGHGNVNESYGLPQADPGWKMASAGADWRTNPLTQLRWMRRYVARFGGECGALGYWNAHGSY